MINKVSLRNAYEAHIKPKRREIAAATLKDYESTLTNWAEFVTWMDNVSRAEDLEATQLPDQAFTRLAHLLRSRLWKGDDVHKISDDVIVVWKDWCEHVEKVAPATINKRQRHLRSIFRKLGPRGPGNPQGVSVRKDFLFFEAAHEASVMPHVIGDEELKRIWEAVEEVTWPHCRNRVQQWRTYIKMQYYCGMRTTDGAMLRVDQWIRQELCPEPGSEVRHPLGWLMYVPVKTQRHKDRRVIIPLHPIVAAALEALPNDGESIFVFGKPNNMFHRQWRVICKKANSTANVKDLRKTANTHWRRVSPDLGEFVLGHVPRDVNSVHYTSPSQALVDALPKLHVPEVFK